MGRCYGCCQENCGYTHCSCSCHNGVSPLLKPVPTVSDGTRKLVAAQSLLAREAVRLRGGGGGHGGGSPQAIALVDAIECVLSELRSHK